MSADLQELCDLYRRRWEEVRELGRLADKARKQEEDTGPMERESERLLADNEKTRADILSTEAHTVAGVLAKIKHHYADEEIEAFERDSDPDDLPGLVAASVYRDLERMTGRDTAMTDSTACDALHDWEDSLAKLGAAKDALLDFLNVLDDKEPGYQGVFCIAYTLELVCEEGRRAFDIVHKCKAEEAA
jgi:hypothetical protein